MLGGATFDWMTVFSGELSAGPQLIPPIAPNRSVVKIKNVCTGTAGTDYSVSSTPIAWTSGSTSPDKCVVQYTLLSDSALVITAIGLDGADNLWVRPVLEHASLSVKQLRTIDAPQPDLRRAFFVLALGFGSGLPF